MPLNSDSVHDHGKEMDDDDEEMEDYDEEKEDYDENSDDFDEDMDDYDEVMGDYGEDIDDHGDDGHNHGDAQREIEALRQGARAIGFSEGEAAVFADIALTKVREAAERRSKTGEPMTSQQVVQAIQQHVVQELQREREQQKLREQAAAQRPGIDLAEVMEMDDGDQDEYLMAMYGAETGGGGVDMAETHLVGPPKRQLVFTDDGLDDFFGPDNRDPYGLEDDAAGCRQDDAAGCRQDDAAGCRQEKQEKPRTHQGCHAQPDLITALCQRVELAVELAKHLGPRDILNLYSVSCAFNTSINGHLLSSVRQIIAHAAPDAGLVFNFRLYRRILVPDPVGRSWAALQQGRDRCDDTTTTTTTTGTTTTGTNTNANTNTSPSPNANQVRAVPGIRYLQLVLLRHRCCHDILAIMARHGHRTPPGTHGALLRMWMMMEVATSRQRQAVLRSPGFWSDHHLYTAQLFIIKLAMLFNDPVYGPSTSDLIHLVLGQRGLYTLWKLLIRRCWTSMMPVLRAGARYNMPRPAHHHHHHHHDGSVFHVALADIGIGHLEGWGHGHTHLMRPDELLPYEALYRGIHLDQHISHMAKWGFVHWQTHENLVPTEQEMFIPARHTSLAHFDTGTMWQPKHALKKRWNSLSSQQQQDILFHDRDQRLRGMAWASQSITTSNAGEDYDVYDVSDWSSDVDQGYYEDHFGDFSDDDLDSLDPMIYANQDGDFDSDLAGQDVMMRDAGDESDIDDSDSDGQSDDMLRTRALNLNHEISRGYIIRCEQHHRHGYGSPPSAPRLSHQSDWDLFSNRVQRGQMCHLPLDERLRALVWEDDDLDDPEPGWNSEWYITLESYFADATLVLPPPPAIHDAQAPHSSHQHTSQNVAYGQDAANSGQIAANGHQDVQDQAHYIQGFFNNVVNATGQGQM